MLLSAVSVLVVAQSSSEIPEGLMNNPVFYYNRKKTNYAQTYCSIRYRFKLLDNATCVCKQGNQTIDLLYQCNLLEKQRGILKKNIVNTGHWPASKQELITKYRESFISFIESIDFDLL